MKKKILIGAVAICCIAAVNVFLSKSNTFIYNNLNQELSAAAAAVDCMGSDCDGWNKGDNCQTSSQCCDYTEFVEKKQ